MLIATAVLLPCRPRLHGLSHGTANLRWLGASTLRSGFRRLLLFVVCFALLRWLKREDVSFGTRIFCRLRSRCPERGDHWLALDRWLGFRWQHDVFVSRVSLVAGRDRHSHVYRREQILIVIATSRRLGFGRHWVAGGSSRLVRLRASRRVVPCFCFTWLSQEIEATGDVFLEEVLSQSGLWRSWSARKLVLHILHYWLISIKLI